MRYIYREREADVGAAIGGKARALADLREADLPIPSWIVLSPDAFSVSLSAIQREAFQKMEQARENPEVRDLLEGLKPSRDVETELQAALAELCPRGEFVAVRSSASDEDGAQHSFAGQLDSFLFVAAEDVREKVAAVWRSGFNERIMAYRREHGLLPQMPRPPAVLIQRMVQADVSGVAFG